MKNFLPSTNIESVSSALTPPRKYSFVQNKAALDRDSIHELSKKEPAVFQNYAAKTDEVLSANGLDICKWRLAIKSAGGLRVVMIDDWYEQGSNKRNSSIFSGSQISNSAFYPLPPQFNDKVEFTFIDSHELGLSLAIESLEELFLDGKPSITSIVDKRKLTVSEINRILGGKAIANLSEMDHPQRCELAMRIIEQDLFGAAQLKALRKLRSFNMPVIVPGGNQNIQVSALDTHAIVTGRQSLRDQELFFTNVFTSGVTIDETVHRAVFLLTMGSIYSALMI